MDKRLELFTVNTNALNWELDLSKLGKELSKVNKNKKVETWNSILTQEIFKNSIHLGTADETMISAHNSLLSDSISVNRDDVSNRESNEANVNEDFNNASKIPTSSLTSETGLTFTNVKKNEDANDINLECKDMKKEKMNPNTRIESMPAIHTSLSSNPDDEDITSFDDNVYFGLDSCSTSHVFNDVSLFLKDAITEVMDSGILGAGGVENVTKKGTIIFKIIDSYGKESIVNLESVFWV